MLKSFKIATSRLGTQTVDNMSRLTNAKDFINTNVNEVDRDYNSLGRLTSETQMIGLISRTVGKQYNLVGRVSKLTYPTSREIDYTFDDNHLPHTTTTDSTVVATYDFNAVNAPVTKTLGNNVSLNIEYNNRYQIKKHDWKLNGNTITGYNYGHDLVGNRIWSENLVTANKSEHFVFDNADRLTSFKTGTLNTNKDDINSPTYSQSWDLDEIGNWEGFTDNGNSSTNTFSDTHEMTEFKGQAISYDNNGNMIFDGIRTFKYDAFNRIIEVKVSSVVLAEYSYDAFNRRVMKKVDADLNSSFETTRYYSTSMGSFVTRDPLGYVDGLSMYLGYFGGQGRDPEGLFKLRLKFGAYIPKSKGQPVIGSTLQDITFQVEPNWNSYIPALFYRKHFGTDNREGPSQSGSDRLYMIAELDTDSIGECEADESVGKLGVGKPNTNIDVNVFADTSHQVEAYYEPGKGKIIKPGSEKTIAPVVKSKEIKVKDYSINSTVIYVKASAHHPFSTILGFNYSPDITWEVTWTLTKGFSNLNGDFIKVKVKGTHNNFPNYEALANDDILYDYRAPGSGPGLLNLNFSTDFSKESDVYEKK